MINPLTSMYGLRDASTMSGICNWLDTTWAFELGFLQPAHDTTPEAYFPLSCPLCDPTYPSTDDLRPGVIRSLREFVKGPIPPGDPITYSMHRLVEENKYNALSLRQLYVHIRRKSDTCPMHNIYEVILYVLYRDALLHLFPDIVRDPCDGQTQIPTPTLNHDGDSTSCLIVRHHPYPST